MDWSSFANINKNTICNCLLYVTYFIKAISSAAQQPCWLQTVPLYTGGKEPRSSICPKAKKSPACSGILSARESTDPPWTSALAAGKWEDGLAYWPSSVSPTNSPTPQCWAFCILAFLPCLWVRNLTYTWLVVSFLCCCWSKWTKKLIKCLTDSIKLHKQQTGSASLTGFGFSTVSTQWSPRMLNGWENVHSQKLTLGNISTFSIHF